MDRIVDDKNDGRQECMWIAGDLKDLGLLERASFCGRMSLLTMATKEEALGVAGC